MTFRQSRRHASIAVLCVGAAFLVATAGFGAKGDPASRVFPLRHVKPDDAAEKLTRLLALKGSTDRISIEVDREGNQLLVRGESDAIEVVAQLLRVLDQKVKDDDSSPFRDLDLEKMADVQLRQHIAALTKSLLELSLRVQRLEQSLEFRILLIGPKR